MAEPARAGVRESLSEFLGQLDLRGQCWCAVDVRGSSGFNMPPGDAVLVYAVVEGSVRIAGVEGGTIALAAGDVAILLSGESHAVRSDPDSLVRPLDFLREGRQVDVPPTIAIGDPGPVTTRLIAGRLTAAWPRGLARGAIPPVVRLGQEAPGPLRADAMQQAIAGGGAATMLTRLAALMLVMALREHAQARQLLTPETKDPIAQALRLIAYDPAADWSVEGLAHAVGMGRSSFAARFAQEVGRAPMEVITDQRMHYAAGLLREGDLKMAEIAARVGYGSEGAFSRRFTRHFGVSPSHVRRTAQRSAPEDRATAAWRALMAGDGWLPTERAAARRPLRGMVGLTRFSR